MKNELDEWIRQNKAQDEEHEKKIREFLLTIFLSALTSLVITLLTRL